MAREDRKKTFERALARSLRSSSGEAGRPRIVCADAETLAAYHEGSLELEEMKLWKEHLVGCPRCQEALTFLKRTDDVPVDTGEHQQANVLAMKTAGIAQNERQTSRRRLAGSWRWVAPAGALAAGLLVWIVGREMRPPDVDIAQKQGHAVSEPAAAPHSQGGPSAKAPELKNALGDEKTAERTRNADPGKQRAPLKLQDKRDKDVGFGGKGILAPPHANESPARLFQDAPALGESNVSARADAEAKKLEKENAPPPAPALSPAAPQPEIATSSVAVTDAMQAQTVPKAKGAVAGALASEQRQEQQIGGRSLYRQSSALVLANSKSLATISAPNGKSVWRVGASGLIEHSSDAGGTWSLQMSGVMADLVAGSAPSDRVCWIAGRAGTILRTTDGGAHWAKVHASVVEDFTSVFAVNPEQATVSSAQGTYQTTDGGLTWSKLAPE